VNTTTTRQENKPGKDKLLKQAVRKFLILWFLSLLALVVIVSMVDINWSRPHLEKVLLQSLHRKAKLGSLRWHLGLNGLAVDTSSIKLIEPNNEPFLNAQASEIGIAFLPLLQGTLIIKHIRVEKPVIYALRLDQDKWNFSDLLTEGPELHYLEIVDGIIKFHNEKPSSEKQTASNHKNPFEETYWTDFQVNDVQLKLVFPRKDHHWPIYVSFKTSNKKEPVVVRFSVVGYGNQEQWTKHKMVIDMAWENLKLEQLHGLIPASYKGISNGGIHGEGVFEKGINLEVKGSAKQALINIPDLGPLPIEVLTLSGPMLLTKQDLTWKNLTISIDKNHMISQGSIKNYGNPTAQNPFILACTTLGEIKDFSSIRRLLNSNKYLQQINKEANLENLGGSARFSLSIDSTKKKQPVWVNVTAQNINLEALLKNRTLPFAVNYLISQSPYFSGQIGMSDNNNLELNKGNISFNRGKLNKSKVDVSGVMAPNFNDYSLRFSGNHLPAGEFLKEIFYSPEINKKLRQTLILPNKETVTFTGFLDLTGVIAKQGRQVDVDLVFNDFGIDSGSKLPKLRNFNGNVKVRGTTISLNNVTGYIGNSPVKINGNVNQNAKGPLELSFDAKDLDLSQLSNLLTVIKRDIPLLKNRQLYGTLKEAHLHAQNGPSMIISGTATPKDLYYKTKTRAIHATAGNIIFNGDNLNLKDLLLVGSGGKLSLSVNNTGNNTLITAASEGITLADLRFYLTSPLMPEETRKSIIAFESKNQIGRLTGTLSGQLSCQSTEQQQLYNGNLTLNECGLRFRKARRYSLRQINGNITINPLEVTFNNITGTINDSVVQANGSFSNYLTADPSWKAKFAISGLAQEIVRLIPTRTRIQAASSGSVDLNLDLEGNFKESEAKFALTAYGQNDLSIQCEQTSLQQPSNCTLKVTGKSLIKSTNNSTIFELKESELSLQDNVLEPSGTIIFPENSQDPFVNVTVKSRGKVKAQLLEDIFNGKAKPLSTGLIDGSVQLEGPMSQALLKGGINFEKLNIPSLNLENASGRLISETGIPLSQDETLLAKTNPRVDLLIETGKLSGLQTKNFKATIELKHSSSLKEVNVASGFTKDGILVNARASTSLAGGNADIALWLAPDTRHFYCSVDFKDVDSNGVLNQSWGIKDEVSGVASGHIELSGESGSEQINFKGLNGTGHISVTNGKVARFGQLQEKLNQANLIQQGIFGFNLNNLLQTVVPVRTGAFKEMRTAFDIRDGVIDFKELRYSGIDMVLRAAGKYDLVSNKMDIEIAGNIPRVSSSLLSGTVGEVSKELTIQKLLHVITFRQLESLPSLPIIGDIATDRPRAFTFKVNAPLDQQGTLISKSIEKSFRWLPSQPTASAHPIPGI
jgi:hypothetical protein